MLWFEATTRRTALATGLASLLAACGFEPLYDPGGPAAALDGRVAIDVIPGTPGFLMRERLIERLGPATAPTHRLAVELSLSQVGVAITEQDVTNRYDVIGVADWRLYANDATRPVMAEQSRYVTGYSAPSSATAQAYAVQTARQNANERLALVLADRIAQRIAVASANWTP